MKEEKIKCLLVEPYKLPKEIEIDNLVMVIAFIFDINFKESFQILKQEDYINKTLDRYNFKDEYTKQKVEEIRKIANRYIESKL